jgi:uncharacterized delta-60 repeat protein
MGAATLPSAAAGAAVDSWRVSRPTSAVRAADGSVLTTMSLNEVWRLEPDGSIEIVAGTGQQDTDPSFSGDGGPATEANFYLPDDVALLPDGGFLVADTGNGRIRRVFPDGHVDTVAGGGHDGPGCLATRVSLDETTSVSPTPDGGFVLTDYNQARRVWPDGSLTTIPVAPDLTQIRDIEPVPEGGYLVAADHGVWRLAPDGSSRQVAGRPNGEVGDSGDGGPATEALLRSPYSVAPLRGGGYLFSDFDNGKIRAVDAAGTISTYRSGLDYPWGISADPDGDGGVLVAEWEDDHVNHFAGAFAPPTFAPPVSGGYQGTGGYEGDCKGFDPSFDGGSVAVNGGGMAHGMVVQPDGKLVLAGDGTSDGGSTQLFLMRLRTDGKRDATFGDGGAVTHDIGESFNAYGVVRQSTGRLVVSGRSWLAEGGTREVLVGLTPDGALDPSFGEGGVATVELSDSGPPAGRIALAPGDRIMVSDGRNLVRLLPDGDPDPSFGEDGPVIAGAEAITVQPDGRTLGVGGNLTTARYLPDGSPDRSFNHTGVLAGPIAYSPWFHSSAVTLDGDGRILAGGYDDFHGEAVVMRLDPDGGLDRSFGRDGVATFHALPGAAQPLLQLGDIAARDDGRIVLAGGQQSSRSGQTILVLKHDGALDPSFGDGGRVISSVGDGGAFFGVASLPGGKLLAGGYGLFEDYVAVRYLVPELPPSDPPPAPAAIRPAPDRGAPAAPRAVRAQPRLRVGVPLRIGLRRLRRPGLRVAVQAPRAGRLTLTLSGDGRRLAHRRLRVRHGATVLRLRVRRVPRRASSLLLLARLAAPGGHPMRAATRVLLKRR